MGIAETGKTTVGWFHGFKLHLIVNDKGELLSIAITPGNIDDRDPLRHKVFLKNIFGKLFGDRGYIGSELMQLLFIDGIQLITRLRKNMKGKIMSVADSIFLRKRALIECINDELKNICQIEHTRHRSVVNFFTNLISGLIAYCFLPKKPAITYQPAAQDGQLSLYY